MKLNARVLGVASILTVGLFSPWISAKRKTQVSVPRARTHLHIVDCHDGDTCTARHKEGWTLKLRLVGIDAPEVAGRKFRGKAKPAQTYGTEAKHFLNQQVAGKDLPVDIVGNDVYHRYLAVLWSSDGKIRINEELVRRGYAFAYRAKAADPEARKWAEAAEALARQEKLGFWALPTSQRPADPTLFRRKNR